MSVKNNPTVGSIKNVLDQAADGSVALPITLVDTASGPINKNPTIGRLEQALAVAEDGSMALPVEVVKLADDGSTFERVTEFGGGGGGGTSEPVTWPDIQNKPTTYPPTAHNHNDIYYTKTDIDNAGYLLAQPDGETVEIQGGELKARALTGLQLGVTQLNTWLSGTQDNIQQQINSILDDIAAIGRPLKYLTDVETYADLMAITSMQDGHYVIVWTDESRENDRTWYVYRGDLGTWRYMGSLSLTNRFTSLLDTPNVFDSGKYLRSGINGLYFDSIRYNDVDDRPDRTKAQIEQAVDKAHTHPNKGALDRIGIDERGRVTVDDEPQELVPQLKQHLFAYRSGSNQTLTSGTDCVFNAKLTGDIPYNTSTGVFTLDGGKTYRVMVEGSLYTSGYVTLQLVDAQTNSIVNTIARGIWMDVNPSTTSWHESSSGPLKSYVTPTDTREYKIRATSVSGESSLRSSYMSLEIQEV